MEFAGHRGIEVPSPRKKGSRSHVAHEVPGPVLDALIEIISRQPKALPAKVLCEVMWADVQVWDRHQMAIAIPGEAHTFGLTSKNLITPIREWAAPCHPEDPFIPTQSGGIEAMPFAVLRRLLARRKRTRAS